MKGKVVRKLRYTEELADLIEFGVNVFIRLSDIKDLRHKHVKVVKKDRLSEATLLELTVPHPKTNGGHDICHDGKGGCGIRGITEAAQVEWLRRS